MKRSKLYRNGVGISGMDFTSDGILITHPSKKEIVAGTQFEPTVTAQLSPGFFYIGDREFYYYNRKATEYHKADVLLNLITITLANYPMGFVPYIRWLRHKHHVLRPRQNGLGHDIRVPTVMLQWPCSAGGAIVWSATGLRPIQQGQVYLQ